MFVLVMWHMYKLWSEGAFYSLYSTKLFSRDIVPTLMFFRRFIFNCDFGRPLPLWRNVTQIEPGTLCIWALSYWTVTKTLGLPTVSCQCRSGQPMLRNFRWTKPTAPSLVLCCLSSISPAVLWDHPQRSCEGEKNCFFGKRPPCSTIEMDTSW